MLTLDQLFLGEKAIVKDFSNPDISLKLLELGCVPGTTIQIERISPMKDPIAVRVAGTLIAMRIEEAKSIIIERQ